MWEAPELRWLHVWDNRRTSHRMLNISLPQGRSKRRGEARTLRYVECSECGEDDAGGLVRHLAKAIVAQGAG